MLSNLKSIILIAFAVVLTISNVEAHPTPIMLEPEIRMCTARGCY